MGEEKDVMGVRKMYEMYEKTKGNIIEKRTEKDKLRQKGHIHNKFYISGEVEKVTPGRMVGKL
jgi:hypothetical protein